MAEDVYAKYYPQTYTRERIAQRRAVDQVATAGYEFVEAGALDGSTYSGLVIYPTFADMEADSVSADVETAMTLGYYEAGDGGGATYRRVDVAPSHALYGVNVGGAIFEFAANSADMRQNGVRFDNGVTNNTPMINELLAWSGMKRAPVYGQGSEGKYAGCLSSIILPEDFHWEMESECEIRRLFSTGQFVGPATSSSYSHRGRLIGGILSHHPPTRLLEISPGVVATSNGTVVTVRTEKLARDGTPNFVVGDIVSLSGIADHAYRRDQSGTRRFLQFTITSVDTSNPSYNTYTMTENGGTAPGAGSTDYHELAKRFPKEAGAYLRNGFQGNLLTLDGDDTLLMFTRLRENGPAGRAVAGQGDRVRWLYAQVHTSGYVGGTGGFRFTGGEDFRGIGLTADCGDGAFQFAASQGNELKANRSTKNAYYIGCNGISKGGTMILAALGSLLDCKLEEFGFDGMTGFASGRLMRARDTTSNFYNLLDQGAGVYAVSNGTTITIRMDKDNKGRTLFRVGQRIVIAGLSPSTFNGLWQISATDNQGDVTFPYDPDIITLVQATGGPAIPAAGNAVTNLVLGAELLTDGTFTATGGKTLGTGWSETAGVGRRTNVGSGTSIVWTVGGIVPFEDYFYSFEIKSYTGTAGARGQIEGSPNVNGGFKEAVGVYTGVISAPASATGFAIRGDNGFAGDIDNVSFKKVTSGQIVPQIQREPLRRVRGFHLSGDFDAEPQTPNITNPTQNVSECILLMNAHDGIIDVNIKNPRGSAFTAANSTGILVTGTFGAPRIAGQHTINIDDDFEDIDEDEDDDGATTAQGYSNNDVTLGPAVVHGGVDTIPIRAKLSARCDITGVNIKDIPAGVFGVYFDRVTSGYVGAGTRFNGKTVTSKGVGTSANPSAVFVDGCIFTGLTCPDADKITFGSGDTTSKKGHNMGLNTL